MKKMKVGILGATGLVGQNFVNLLSEHPYFEIGFLAASEKSTGKTYGDAVDWKLKTKLSDYIKGIKIIDISLDSIIKENIDIVFNALPSGVGGNIEKRLRENGRFVFSNSSTNRMEPDIPIIITEINSDHFKFVKTQKTRYGGAIITNSNCVVSGFVFALKPLLEFGVKSVIISTYQAISGAGINGISAFEMNSNIIPHIKKEEEKIENETLKILGKIKGNRSVIPRFPVIANSCRVGVLIGHLESITIEFENDISVELIKERLKNFKGEPQKLELPLAPDNPIILREEENRPQPSYDCFLPEGKRGGMAVVIGRVRKKGNRISLYLLVNNLVRGAAGQSVLNAEYAYKNNLFGGI
jgi:aspartate-semialdehyde dehydrogenase